MGRSEEIRAEVRSWIAEHWSRDLTVGEWWRRLADARLAMPMWPEPYGRGYRGAEARVVTEELAAASVIAPPQGAVGTTLAGPTILEHGTEEQKERYLWPLLRGEESWCQLFSEPGAGSDLAGLGTRAATDGDEWAVTGQKVWNSAADIADRGMLLARTDVDVPKHAGITYFLLDMDQPGIEARPLRQMNGEAHFCEVFINDARLHRDEVLDGLGNGWKVAATTLRNERSMVAGGSTRGLTYLPSGRRAGQLDRVVADVLSTTKQQRRTFVGNAVPARKLIALSQERGVADDPILRQQLARYYTLTQINRFTQLRLRNASPLDAARGTSTTKLAISQLCTFSRDLSFSILGADATLWSDGPYDGDLVTVGLASFGTRIGGGTDEIQRNVIGERALGLPREPTTDKDIPYRDLRIGTRSAT